MLVGRFLDARPNYMVERIDDVVMFLCIADEFDWYFISPFVSIIVRSLLEMVSFPETTNNVFLFTYLIKSWGKKQCENLQYVLMWVQLSRILYELA